MALQSDGKILVGGGTFGYVGGQVRSNLARLNADGTLDNSFVNPGLDNYIGFSVFSIAVQTNGKVLIGGAFTSAGGQPRKQLARLNANGTLDTAFTSPLDTTAITSLIVQPDDGKILIGGTLTTLGGQPQNGVARLNANGTPDNSFVNPNISDWVYALARQPDGKIIVGGNFSTAGGQPRNGVARLNANGTLDASFTDARIEGVRSPFPPGLVNAIAIQPDGKVIIGGNFTTVGGEPRKGVARLNANGTLDTTFANPDTSEFVSSLALQEDGKVLIGGNFTAVGGRPLDRLARLNADGTPDTTFDNPNTDFTVTSVLTQPDGKILAGGRFTRIAGQVRHRVARLIAFDTTPPDTTITSAPSGVVATNTASITFTSSEPESTFSCSVDGAPYAACSSPLNLSALTVGEHSVAVKATDRGGNTDPTPATASWRVRNPDVAWSNLAWGSKNQRKGKKRLSIAVAKRGKLPPGHRIKVFCLSGCRSKPARALVTLSGKKTSGSLGSFSKRGKRPLFRVVQGSRGHTPAWRTYQVQRDWRGLTTVNEANCDAQPVPQCKSVPANAG